MSKYYHHLLFISLAIIAVIIGSSPMALVIGLIFSIFFKNPFENNLKTYIQKLLSISIIGLGAGMNLHEVIATGKSGLFYTISSLVLTFFMGHVLAKIFKVKNEIAILTTAGTAICGGSAIAAVSGAIDSNAEDISISMAIIFILNSVALFVFPPVGHYFHLSEAQFGLWAALAIHDTSSVVGAGLSYGPEALRIATTIKLARALWIIPVTIIISYCYQKWNKSAGQGKGKFKFPWFILGFVLTSLLFTYLPDINFLMAPIVLISKRILVLVLFLIGSNLSLSKIKKLGITTFSAGLILWILVSLISLIVIKQFI